MSRIKWDQVGERRYEYGVDHGVLYPRDAAGAYPTAVPWNGLTAVNESPTGAEATPVYADNIKYLNLVSAEEYAATIEALTYPDEFEACDGTGEPAPGIYVGQQTRQSFGFVYRTNLGNDVTESAGHKLHLVYGALAAVSEKAHNTVNESPEQTAFSWEVTTTPVEIGEVNGVQWKPSATLTLKSTDFTPEKWVELENTLFGSDGATPTEGSLPLPAAIIALMAGGEVVPVTP